MKEFFKKFIERLKECGREIKSLFNTDLTKLFSMSAEEVRQFWESIDKPRD